MADEGVEIYKRFYPWPERFRLGDPVLVTQVTGLSWPEFVEANSAQQRAIDEAAESGEEPPAPDQLVLAGLIAVAFWQGNAQMSREKARRAIERIPLDDIEVVGGDEEDDAVPPAEAAGPPISMPLNGSDASQEASAETAIHLAVTSDETSPNASGEDGLPSSPPESLLA